MNPEDIKKIRIYYETIDGVEVAYTYWNIIKVRLYKEDYSEEELQERFYNKIKYDPYYDISNQAIRNPLYKKSEEI